MVNGTANHTAAEDLFVVGIGASAGGLRALEEYFGNMPSDSNAAFVVVQHLSPDYKSLMSELLGRHTSMTVQQVTEQVSLAPNTVFLIPPGQNLVLENSRLHLIPQDRSQGRQPNFPIDWFFQSLATEIRENTIAIVLSGTGSDGSRGIQEVSEIGGIVLAQDPETAEFDGMPQSAIATGMVDLVLSPSELAQASYQFITSPKELQAFRNDQYDRLAPIQLQQIVDIIERYENIDFTYYKPNSLTRRIQRRCLIAGYMDLDTYIRRLETSEDERAALRNDLLITVTRFFRDIEAWNILRESILPQLIGQATSKQTLRIWVAACATGEEAYSMAMLLRELLDQHQPEIEAKIFATDIDQVALNKAATGIFPAAIEDELSKIRLDRFFVRRDDGRFEVTRALRETIIFANHNLAKDAGFTHMDLVSCRNVLIYMQPDLQNQVLRNLHFALEAKGVLFLGESESLGVLEEEFKILSHKWNIYQKLRDVKLSLQLNPVKGLSIKRLRTYPNTSNQPARFDPLLETAFKTLLQQRDTSCLLVDRKQQLLYVCGDVLNLLKVPDGRASKDVIQMLPQSLQLPLSTALHRVRQGREDAVEYSGLCVTEPSYNDMTVSLKVGRQLANRRTGEFFLVAISHERLPDLGDLPNRFEADADMAHYVFQLEQELQRARENLQATIEELESTNEEQQATNEELIASNEELQSTNEELQSVNEELYTVNAEYQSKIQELTELNNDLNNLLGNIDVGVLFLDNELRIRKFTPAVSVAYSLVEADISRPIGHLSCNLENLDLLDLLEQVREKGVMIEQEVQVKRQGPYLLMRIHPYLTENKTVDGLVLTFVNVDDIKRTQLQLAAAEARLSESNEILEQEVQKRTAALEASQHFLESISQATPNNIYIYDLVEKRNIYTNRSLAEMLGYSQEYLRTIGDDLHTRLFHPEDLERISAYHQNIIEFKSGNCEPNSENGIFSIEYRVRDAAENWRWLYSQDIVYACSDEGQPTQLLGTAIDISDRKATEALLKESEERYALVAQGVGGGIWDWNILSNTNYMSPRFKQILGYEEDEMENLLSSWETHVHPDDIDWVWKLHEEHLQHRTPYEAEYRMKTKADDYIWIYETGQATWDDEGNPIRMAGSVIDISDRKAAEKELQESEARYRSLYTNTPVMLHSIDVTGKIVNVSDYWLQTFGYRRDEVIGCKSTEFLTPESRQYAREVVLPDFFKTGTCRDVPYQWVCKDGRIRDVLLSATAERDASGEFVRSLAMLVDVTEQKQAQAELTRYRDHLEELVEERAAEIKQANQQLQAEISERQQAQSELSKRAQALEQSNADLEQFAYVISHDLQEPLRAMTVFAQLIEGNYGEQLDVTANDYINNIVDGGIRMHALINGILAFSRATHRENTFENIELEQILTAAIDNLNSAIDESQAVITYDTLPTLKADKSQMIQLFQNLVGNAIKFRGTEPPCIHITAKQQATGWLFGVRDNSIGIPKAQQERTFGLFQRLHTRSEKEGYGIGLAVCKKIVERHQGRIWVESEPGHGSIFYFTLSTNGIEKDRQE